MVIRFFVGTDLKSIFVLRVEEGMHQSEIYDNVPVKVKAELFQFSVDDFEADMKLHSLVLKELNVNYYNNEKRWNRSR